MFMILPSSKMGNSIQEVLATASAGSSRTALPGEPPAGPGLAADALLEPWFSCLHERLGELRIFDCHTHLGCADPDGSCFEVDELLDALAAVDGRAVVFPLAEPGGYRAANDGMLAAAEASDGRLAAFCRVDPHDGAVSEVERAVGRGAARRGAARRESNCTRAPSSSG